MKITLKPADFCGRLAVRLLAPNKVTFMSTRTLWLAAILVCGFCGCSGDASKTGPGGEAGSGATTTGSTSAPTPTKASRGTIGVSLLAFENPFFKVIADHIDVEARKNGYDTILLSADNDATKQSNQVKDFIVSKVAAIVLSPADPHLVVSSIQDANAAGIPVFTVDIPCPSPDVKIVSQIATDNFGGGREAGNAIIEVLGPQGGSVAILGFAAAQSCTLRVKGFKEVIEAHNANAANKITIVGEYESEGKRDRGAAAMKDILQSNDGLNAVFAINDPAALGARAALEQAGKADSVVIVGFDGQPEGKLAIREGKIYADPIQFPDRMGVEVVQAIIAHSKGKEVPAETLIPTKLYKKADAEQDSTLK